MDDKSPTLSSVPTPGNDALQAMQDLETKSITFKKPKLAQKKRKQKILSEEHYVQELGKIIQRDFFPDLAKLKAQNEYLDAKERNDLIKLRDIYSKYSGNRPMYNHASSPATFETPIRSNNQTPMSQTSHKSNKTTAVQTSLSEISNNYTVDSFLNDFTSEDNHSFQEIIDAADNKLKKKFALLFNEEKVSALKIAEAMKLPAIADQFKEDLSKELNTWQYRNKNYIMYIPDGVDLKDDEKINSAVQKPKIDHINTRLLINPFNETRNKETINKLANNQTKVLNGKIGVDGNTVENHQITSVNNHSFVMTPSPCPGDICGSPLMTWGEIEGTPFRLDGSDTPIRNVAGPSFRINETSRRENIAIELAEKAGERMRFQKQVAKDTARRNIGSPYINIRNSIDRKMAMSPAARKLAHLKLGLRSTSVTPQSYRSLKSNTKQMVKQTTPSPRVRIATPTGESFKLKNKQTGQVTNLTDDLLNIPIKRTQASDFF